MASTVFPAASGGGAITWTLLGTETPANTVSTYTFSGLSGYKQYRLVSKVNLSPSSSVYIQINGLGYGYYGSNLRSLLNATWASSVDNSAAQFSLSGADNGSQSTDFIIEDMSNSKSASWTNTSSRVDIGNGVLNLSTAITSLRYYSNNNFSSGLIRLYGGN